MCSEKKNLHRKQKKKKQQPRSSLNKDASLHFGEETLKISLLSTALYPTERLTKNKSAVKKAKMAHRANTSVHVCDSDYE